jgi:hypothetical protein
VKQEMIEMPLAHGGVLYAFPADVVRIESAYTAFGEKLLPDKCFVGLRAGERVLVELSPQALRKLLD